MSHTRKTVLVIAMFVASAVAVASASAALPEFDGPFPNTFTALQLTTGILQTVGGRTVECEHGSASGTIKSAKDALVNGIKFTGCKSVTFGAKCNSSGAATGEIVSLPLLGLLGYITASTKLVGILLEPDNGGTHFATFECTIFQKLIVRGSVICHLSPVNTLTTNYHLECTAKNGVQSPLTFDGLGQHDTLTTQGEGLETFGPEQSGVTALSDITTANQTLLLA